MDSEEPINRLLPFLDENINEGLITMEKVRVIRYRGTNDRHEPNQRSINMDPTKCHLERSLRSEEPVLNAVNGIPTDFYKYELLFLSSGVFRRILLGNQKLTSSWKAIGIIQEDLQNDIFRIGCVILKPLHQRLRPMSKEASTCHAERSPFGAKHPNGLPRL